MITLLTPTQDAVLDLCTTTQRQFAKNSLDYATPAFDWRHLTETTDPDCSLPAPIHFAWEAEVSAPFTLEIAHTEAFAENMVRSIECTTAAVDVYNLEIGRRYFWRVRQDGAVSAVRSFFTCADAPRWLYIDGTTNVRDLGGWRTPLGDKPTGKIRQGLLYRGSEMDIHKTITDAGIAELRDHLAVKTDLDLRGEVVGKRFDSPLGDTVQFRLVPIGAYDEFFKETEPYREIFSILADPDNYPIYFHCWGGADRTGSLACLIEALCGVSDADQDTDYELTSLSVWGQRSSRGEGWQAFQSELGTLGNTRLEQARGFLRRAGVTDAVMDRVVEILVED